MQPGAAPDALPVLQDGKGTVAFQLKASALAHDEVLDVQVHWCKETRPHASTGSSAHPLAS